MTIPEYTATIPELLDKTIPELLGSGKTPHTCIYRDLLGKFVSEDLLKHSTARLEGESH